MRRRALSDGREHADERYRLPRRFHPQIAWAKLRFLRDGAAIASEQEVVELNSKCMCGMKKNKIKV